MMSITALGEEHREIIMNALRGRDPVVVINEYYNDADKVCPPENPTLLEASAGLADRQPSSSSRRTHQLGTTGTRARGAPPVRASSFPRTMFPVSTLQSRPAPPPQD